MGAEAGSWQVLGGSAHGSEAGDRSGACEVFAAWRMCGGLFDGLFGGVVLA